MSTFLGSLAVVIAAIAGVLWIAATGQNQSATPRRQRPSAPPPPTRAAERAAGTDTAVLVAWLSPMGAALGDAAAGYAAPERRRSAMVLVLLLAVVGLLVALAIGSGVLVTALTVRDAAG